jgi:structural maintenance of chromosome 2
MVHRPALQVVAKLVHLKDPATALALEVTAGGRLYQVVVDSDATAKSLLQKGGLQKRVTIIPLNQVRRLLLPPMAVRMGSRSRWCAVSFLVNVDFLLV